MFRELSQTGFKVRASLDEIGPELDSSRALALFRIVQESLANKTVENYRARLKTKLGVDRRSDLVALALKAGLLQDDQ